MGPKLNLPRIFLGKTKGEQRGGLLFFFHNPSTNQGVPQLMVFLGSSVNK
jgi:hypothetical protein